MSGFGLNKTVTANVTPSTIVFFDKVTPTTAGVVFTPNTPATTDILYVSSVNSSTWIWDGSAYISYAAPSVSSTEWYLYGTSIDAGSNKTASIQRSGAIFVNVDSYFYDVRVGRGNGSISSNTIVGDKCLLSNTTGSKIVAVGYGALQINTASNNTAIGWGSLNANTTGSSNVAIGTSALQSNTASNNTTVGFESAYANTTGSSNSFFGASSGRFNTTGTNLSSIGVASLYNNTTGSDNVGLGLHTLFSNVTGSNNTSVGNFAGRFLNNGSSANTTPENSVFLGYSTRALTNNDTNQIVIGYQALGKGSNTVQLGNTSITDTYLQGAVTFNNAYKLPTTAPTSGQVLGYLGAGTTQWTTAGLSYFTEAQATTGVNATVYANSLTTVSATASADFVIQAKGNGSIVNVIPDGTATGGNKRGTKCLDLQTSRTSAARIAGGTGNVILNGVDNYITSPTVYSVVIGQNSGITGGGNSLVVGDSCQMSGTNSLAVGSCTVTGSASASIGSSSVSGGNSLAVGAYGTVSGTFCIGAGRGYVIDGFYSAGFGLGAKNYGHSTRIVNGTFDQSANDINYQGSWFQLAAYTTTATATLLYSYNGTNTSSIDLQNNNLMRIKGMIIGKQVSSVNSAIFDIDVTVVRGATSGTVTILGTPSISLLANTGGFGTPTITISSSGIDFKVIGLAATTIKWSARLDSVEVIA